MYTKQRLVLVILHGRLWVPGPGISSLHDDVIKWTHFPRYWPFVRGIHRYPVNSPHKGQWRGALMFTLICARINGWLNNREAGDLRRHRAYSDVIVMVKSMRVLCWAGVELPLPYYIEKENTNAPEDPVIKNALYDQQTPISLYRCQPGPLQIVRHPWWRHQMETFSALLALCAGNSPVTGEFPSQRPVTRSFDVFFDLRLNKQIYPYYLAGLVQDYSNSIALAMELLQSCSKPSISGFCFTDDYCREFLVAGENYLGIMAVEMKWLFHDYINVTLQ